MTVPDPSRIRASDGDRERAAAALSQAFSQGQLDYSEFDERTRQIWATKYQDELLVPLSDLYPDPQRLFDGSLPAALPDQAPQVRPRQEPVRIRVTGDQGGDSFSFAVMGSSERTGDWLCAPTHTSLAIMGGTDIDLRQARLGSRETVIYAVALMGGMEITVPEDVHIISDGIGIMGGFGISDDRSVTLRREDIPPGAPVIHVRGLALMGGVGVTRKAYGAK